MSRADDLLALPKNLLTDREQGHYSLTRAILTATEKRSGSAPDSFEREISDELRRVTPTSDQPTNYGPGGSREHSISVPLEVLPRNLWVLKRGAHEVATASKGGELKFNQPAGLIDILRKKSVIAALGATILTGLQGDFYFPRKVTTMTTEWDPESQTADITSSAMTFDNVKLTPKQLSGATSYSRKLLAQSVQNAKIDALVAGDVMDGFAIELDRVAINGTGANNQPTGILNVAGIGSVAGGANGAAPTHPNVVDLEYEVGIDDADLGNLGFATTPKVRQTLRKAAQISGSTGMPVWFNGNLLDYPALASNNVPANLTKGTSTTICSAIIFGRWEELLVGQWSSGFDIVADPYTFARRGDIAINALLMVDVGVRHPVSFAAMKDAL